MQTVYLSPLRRSIQTAYFAFRDAPNFSSIKFILHPDLGESLGNADDIPEDIRTVWIEYYNYFPTGLDPSLFEDLLYPVQWFVNSLTLKATRDAVY